MIKAKHDGQYKQVGFIKVRQPDGTYKDVEKKYGKTVGGEYGLVFEKGFTRQAEGALPLQLDGIRKPLKDYNIEGNTYQSDGVSSDTPQEVKGCGERTGNLFDKDNADVYNAYLNSDGEWINNNESICVKILCDGGTQYTLSVNEPLLIFRIYEYADDTVIPDKQTDKQPILNMVTRSENISQYTFTTATDTKCIVFQGSYSAFDTWINSLILNLGSTPLPYEPYGYKMNAVTRGKNLLKLKDDYVADVRGVSVSIKNGTLTINGTAASSGGRTVYLSESNVLKAGTYTLSGTMISGLTYCLTKVVDGSAILATSKTSTFTLTEDVVVAFGLKVVGGTAYDTNANVMLELGNTATEYSPYVEPITTPLYLDSPLYKIGDYADVRGMTEEVRTIRELVLTGMKIGRYSP